MKAMTMVMTFIRSEDGAVTADWIVMAGGAVGLAFVLATSIGSVSVDYGRAIETTMVKRGIVTY